MIEVGEKKVIVEGVDIIEDDEKEGIVEFADCWPEETKLAVVVVVAGGKELMGISIGSSVVVWLLGLPGIPGRGKVEGMGEASSRTGGLVCTPG